MNYFRQFLTDWIVSDDQLFAVVEGEKFRRLLRLLNTNAKPLSADTIHNDIISSFKEEKNKIQEILLVFFSKIFNKLYRSKIIQLNY
jgi:uncharacterized protein YdaU (DUF1376 family)